MEVKKVTIDKASLVNYLYLEYYTYRLLHFYFTELPATYTTHTYTYWSHQLLWKHFRFSDTNRLDNLRTDLRGSQITKFPEEAYPYIPLVAFVLHAVAHGFLETQHVHAVPWHRLWAGYTTVQDHIWQNL